MSFYRYPRRFLRRFSAVAITISIVLTMLSTRPSNTAHAFFPTSGRTLGGFLGRSHQKITEDAIKAVDQEFFGISTLTNSMTKARDELVAANADVDSIQTVAFPHCDGESFTDAQNRISEFFQLTIDSLNADVVSSARVFFGAALHTIQDFYAHSNWVENNGASADGALIPPQGPILVLGPNVPTCKLCSIGIPIDCSSNLVTTLLTSGYYGGEDRVKPNSSKCSHGGLTDTSSFGLTGGINKDCRSPAFSPHFFLHDTAADAALASSEDFFRALKAQVTTRQIKALLGVGPTLLIAMDTTGSMGDIIGQVQASAVAIVDSRLGTDEEPSKYILAPFNDPSVGPVTETTDPDVFKAAINSLTADGGGDCPELSMSGMLQGISASDEGGDLFMFTDADAKDADLADSVGSVAQSKDIKLFPCVFGTCSFFGGGPTSRAPKTTKTTRGIVPESVLPVDPAYIKIANDSGGQLFALARSEAGAITQLANFVVRSNAVDIASVADTFAGSAKTYTVPVDSRTSSVTFSVSGTTNVVINRPDGTTVQPTDPGVSSLTLTGTAVSSITTPAQGAWSVTVNGTGDFSLAVSGTSTLNFTSFDFVQTGGRPGHDGDFPLNGFPLSGQAGTVDAQISLADIQTSQFELHTKQGTLLQTLSVTPVSTDEPNEVTGNLTVPNTPFVVYMTGLDVNGVPYQRVKPGPFRPQTVQVIAPLTQNISPGQTTTYFFQVTNFGPADTFTITAADDQGFLNGTSPGSVSLNTNQTATVTVLLTAPASARLGTLDSLTLNALSVTSPGVSNFAVVRSLVLPSSNLPPDCSKAQPSVAMLWPPNHKMVDVSIVGVTDPDNDPVSITITGVMQNEPTNGLGDGDTCPDAAGIGTSTVQLRAERSGTGNGRLYTVFFTASDGKGGTCQGSVTVCVPHDQNGACPTGATTFDSTSCATASVRTKSRSVTRAKFARAH